MSVFLEGRHHYPVQWQDQGHPACADNSPIFRSRATFMEGLAPLLVRPQHAEDELKTQSLFSTYINVFSAYDLLQV